MCLIPAGPPTVIVNNISDTYHSMVYDEVGGGEWQWARL
jgi:hypothetical protein